MLRCMMRRLLLSAVRVRTAGLCRCKNQFGRNRHNDLTNELWHPCSGHVACFAEWSGNDTDASCHVQWARNCIT